MVPDGLWAILFGWVLMLQPILPATAPRAPEPPSRRQFPVVGAVHYTPYHHDYPAVDVLARCGSRVVAPVDGTVLEIARVDRWSPGTDRGGDRGGKSYSIAGADGVRYYGSHLASVRPALRAGAVVRAGDPIGRVGRTGSARGLPCHLHVGLSPVCARTGDWRVRRGVVNPYPFLRSWQRGGNKSPARAVHRWERHHDCRAAR